MINFLKNYLNTKNEIEDISKKIKNKNHCLINKLNKEEIKRLSKLDKKNKKKRVREIIEDLSGQNFLEFFSYCFDFKEIPFFSYHLHLTEDNYNLSLYGRNEYNGFRCDFLLNENVFRLTLKTKDEFNEDEEDFKRLVGKKAFEISKKIKTKPLEITKKAKKLVSRMISTDYLNEFSYNEMKKNPIRVI